MKKLGNIQSAAFKLNQPKMNVEEMSYNNIMILVGPNGVGKTFVLTLTWVVNTFVNSMLVAKQLGMSFHMDETLQFFFDHSFSNNDIDGEVRFVYEGTEIITIKLQKGKVRNISLLFDDDISPPGQPVYMSKNTRTFQDIIMYVKFKKALGIDPGLPSNEVDMQKLLDSYKIYDIMYMEQLLEFIEKKTTKELLEGFNKRIKEFDKEFSITDLKLDYSKSEITYSNDKVTDQSITTLGAGHQSLTNMVIFQEYVNA